jgi:hypothetical protein
MHILKEESKPFHPDDYFEIYPEYVDCGSGVGNWIGYLGLTVLPRKQEQQPPTTVQTPHIRASSALLSLAKNDDRYLRSQRQLAKDQLQ